MVQRWRFKTVHYHVLEITADMNPPCFTVSLKTGCKLPLIFPSEAKNNWGSTNMCGCSRVNYWVCRLFMVPSLVSCLLPTSSTAPEHLHSSVLLPDWPVHCPWEGTFPCLCLCSWLSTILFLFAGPSKITTAAKLRTSLFCWVPIFMDPKLLLKHINCAACSLTALGGCHFTFIVSSIRKITHLLRAWTMHIFFAFSTVNRCA